MPRSSNLAVRPFSPDWLVWEHVAGDTLAWIACTALSVMIWRWRASRPEWSALRRVGPPLALFVGLGGLGHLLDLIAPLRPMPRLSGSVLVATGLVAAWTAWSLREAWPKPPAMRPPPEPERLAAHAPRARQEVLDHGNASIASGEPSDRTFPPREADGRHREFPTRIVPSRGDDGELAGWLGTSPAIDEQPLAAEKLKASERIYRAIGESIPFGVWICDAEGRNTYASDSFLRLVGLTQEECSDFGWSKILHPDDAERTAEAWKECVRTEGTWDIEHRCLGTDGRYHSVLARGVPVRDDEGRIVSWAGMNLDIGRLKQVERALREAEERQRRALTAARLAHWEWEIAEDRITYQDSLALLYGRPDDRPFANFAEYLGIVHPDDRDLVREAARRALAPGVPYEVEYRVVWPDGSVHWLAGRGGTFFDDAGLPTRMVGVNLDITERKVSESQIRLLNESLEQRVRERTSELAAANAALREGGLRFQAIFEAAFQFIGLLSPDGTLLEANRTALEFGGLERDDVVGRPFWEARWWGLNQATQDRLRGAIQAAASGHFVRYEADVVGANGEVATIDFSLKPIHDDSGRVTLLIPEGRVVTEQKRAAEKLRRSLEALRESQRLAGVGSWEWDPATDTVTWSDELYRIAGRDPSLPAPRYRDHDQIYTPESLALLNSVVTRALEAGEPYEVELEMIRADGLNHWIIARGEAVRDSSGRLVRLQGTSQDITERRVQREELRRARDQAVAAVAAKGDFLANMSHEIRTPMNGVIGMTDLLLGTQLNDRQRRYAETIRTSGEALMTVIDDILDFSKIEAGKLKLEAVDLDLRTVMEEVVDLLAPSADQKGLAIGCRVAPEIPGRLVGDPVRIRQVLTNLVGNAVKFTDHGTVDLEAELLADDGRSVALRILVRDTGIGIPEDRQADIFDSFTQVDGGSSRSHGGTGLGLAICQNLARLMGGSIAVRSRPGAGSTFAFEVSLGRGQGDPDARAEGPRGLRVLVVDGEEDHRVMLRETLRSWECRPEVADSGGAALARLMAAGEDGAFGLILVDQGMPDMDGTQLARFIKTIPRHADVPLVLLGPPGGGEEVDPALWAARLTRPVRRAQLDNILRLATFSPDSLRPHPCARDDERARPCRGLNLLLAEDSEVNRRVASGLAERLGCVVEAVGNGREAIEAIRRGRHDVVLMDVQMPELDGLGATAAIREFERESGRHIPIIALTAHAMQGDRELCLAAGMDGYLSKPLKLGPLREALQTWGLGIEREASEAGGQPEPGLPTNIFGALEKSFGNNPTLVREVLQIMLRDVPARLGCLAKALQDRDGPQVAWEAHGLKGAFLTVGASTLAAACQELITMGERGDFNAIESALGPVRDEWERLAAEAARHLERPSLPEQ